MHAARVIAALAVGTVAGEFFATPLSRLFEAPFGDQAGLAAAVALPLAVAGVGAILAGLISGSTVEDKAPLPDLYVGGHQPGRDPATGRFKAKA